ncbi:hypothetical protein KIN20_036429 [Parelaphostrongylus tenuis]|uniref:Uncharacterized protein n=1 Tax=Parelaphostrongylus tenuis TaxID=148309 RepID=A0AAD5WL75_PARTN|nr:hypothetical protein KIN20_036429 [Parelaphostrongylus tenuis]
MTESPALAVKARTSPLRDAKGMFRRACIVLATTNYVMGPSAFAIDVYNPASRR